MISKENEKNLLKIYKDVQEIKRILKIDNTTPLEYIQKEISEIKRILNLNDENKEIL